jgi:hypothetical protein
MTYVNRHPQGQQRDKPYREALRMELAAAGENMMALREIAKVHIAKCKEGDMPRSSTSICRLRNSQPSNEAEKLSAEPIPIERHTANGNGGLNEDTEGRLK